LDVASTGKLDAGELLHATRPASSREQWLADEASWSEDSYSPESRVKLHDDLVDRCVSRVSVTRSAYCETRNAIYRRRAERQRHAASTNEERESCCGLSLQGDEAITDRGDAVKVVGGTRRPQLHTYGSDLANDPLGISLVRYDRATRCWRTCCQKHSEPDKKK